MDYIIKTEFQGPGFVAVPNYVAQSVQMSPEALGVLVYLASQPRGFLARWSSVCARFGMGKDKWQRIGRELRACGAMHVESIPGHAGRKVGRQVRVCWPDQPETESRESPLSGESTVPPKAGKPAKVSGQTRQSGRANPAAYKEQIKTLEARAEMPAQAGRFASPPKAASRPSADRTKHAQAADVVKATAKACRVATGAKGAGELARAVSVRHEPSAAPVDWVAQGWDRARASAGMGLTWRNPETGNWHPASDWSAVAV